MQLLVLQTQQVSYSYWKSLFCQTTANVERLDGAGAVRLERTKVSGAGWRMIAANEQTNKQDSRRKKTEAMGLEMQSGQYWTGRSILGFATNANDDKFFEAAR